MKLLAILDEVFVISRIIKVDLEVISRSWRLHEADNPQLDHDYSGYRKKRIL